MNYFEIFQLLGDRAHAILVIEVLLAQRPQTGPAHVPVEDLPATAVQHHGQIVDDLPRDAQAERRGAAVGRRRLHFLFDFAFQGVGVELAHAAGAHRGVADVDAAVGVLILFQGQRWAIVVDGRRRVLGAADEFTFFALLFHGSKGQVEGAADGADGIVSTARWGLADHGAATVLDDDRVGGGGGGVAFNRRCGQLRQPLEALLGRVQRERCEDALAADADVGVDDVGQRREGRGKRHLAAFHHVDVAAQFAVLQVVEIDGGASDVQLDAQRLQISVQLQILTKDR